MIVQYIVICHFLFCLHLLLIISAGNPSHCTETYEKVGCFGDRSGKRAFGEDGLQITRRDENNEKFDGIKFDWTHEAFHS